MNRATLATVLFGTLAALLIVALFLLYQNPLMEIYLATWGQC